MRLHKTNQKARRWYSDRRSKLENSFELQINFKNYLVRADVEQVVDKYILLYVLMCGIAKHFCALSRILTSPHGESKYKQRCFRSTLQKSSASKLLYMLKTSLT